MIESIQLPDRRENKESVLKRACLCVFLVCTFLSTYSQGQSTIDSLKKVIATEKDPVKIIRVKFKLVDAYSKAGELDKSIRLNRFLLQEARKTGNKADIADAYVNHITFLF